ncbi:MAG: DUF4304 domain-containing protein, partial [Silvanigrellaceae bacterium]|nr:DUF4304 domain-containing protein [Silvanigrellaceae bacterium]
QNDIFNQLINNLKPLFKSHFYLKKGNTFYVTKDNNYGLVAFQKSQKSTRFEIIFTINIGIYSQVIANFFNPACAKSKPTIADCHWIQRIDNILELPYDKWWLIDENSSISELTHEFYNYLEQIFMEVDKYIKDRDLESLWLSKKSPGITEFNRLRNLSVLLKHSGDIALLKNILNELNKLVEGTACSYLARQHIQELSREL